MRSVISCMAWSRYSVSIQTPFCSTWDNARMPSWNSRYASGFAGLNTDRLPLLLGFQTFALLLELLLDRRQLLLDNLYEIIGQTHHRSRLSVYKLQGHSIRRQSQKRYRLFIVSEPNAQQYTVLLRSRSHPQLIKDGRGRPGLFQQFGVY